MFSTKYKEFGITVFTGTGRVLQNMSNSRVVGDNLRGAVYLAGMGKIRAVLKSMMVPDRPKNVLLNAFLQPCPMY